MTPFFALDRPEALEPILAGGKGAGLARLHAAGFPVPLALILPPTTVTAIASGDVGLLTAISAACADIAQPGGTVAVRSSATDEDSESASFAGQHETVLNVAPTPDELRAAIVRCLASSQTESAATYRAAFGGQQSDMAVVVQRMLQPHVAGVLFTIDPATGDDSRIVIEAVHGLGDTLVSGEVTGERTLVSRKDMSIVESPDADPPALSSGDALSLARLSLRVEAALVGPQDIEFAVDADGIWLLQSRPVTTVARGEFDTPTTSDDYWTAANIQEVLPGLLTPLSITVFQSNADVGYGEGYEELRLLRKGERPRFVGMFYNRAFLNIGATRLIADRAFGSSGDAVEHRFLGGEYRETPHRPNSLELWRFRLTSIPFLARMTLGIEERGGKMAQAAIRLDRQARALDVQSLSDADLDHIRLKVARFGARTFQVHLQASAVAALGFDTISRYVRSVLGDRSEAQLPIIFSGLHGLESAEIGVDMYHLATVAARSGLGDAIKAPGFDPIDRRNPHAWHAAYATFMDRHGHRGINEMEFSATPWRADPTPVLSVVASFLELPADQSPQANLERQELARLELTADVVRGLPWWKRHVFRFQLGYAQRWVALRERTKSAVVRTTRIADYLLPEIGRRLVNHGVIAEPTDVYFLTTSELTEALTGTATSQQLGPRVARRRRDYARNHEISLPERFRGYPQPFSPDEADHTGELLRGTPVSPGIVTGRARVIRDPATDGPLLPGEVLVAPVTDAGWTPIFALASGLVVDMGSALSHGSTIAREYGLPAVVNVRSATRTIRTGDLLRVDGFAGTVLTLERTTVGSATPASSYQDRP